MMPYRISLKIWTVLEVLNVFSIMERCWGFVFVHIEGVFK